MDIIVIGETCFSYDTAGMHDIDSFIQYPACRDSSGGGGLSVFVNKRLGLQHNVTEKIDETFFSITFELMGLNDGKKPLKLVAYYRPSKYVNVNIFMRQPPRCS